MEPRKIIAQFDEFLSQRGLHFEAVVIGGAALALLDVISRQTRDCDILDPIVPTDILAAANEFAIAMRQYGEILQDGWLNHEPASLSKLLPMGWRRDLQLVFKGQAIVLYSLGARICCERNYLRFAIEQRIYRIVSLSGLPSMKSKKCCHGSRTKMLIQIGPGTWSRC